MRILTCATLLALSLAAPTVAWAEVKNWRYKGVEYADGAVLAFVAQTSVSDDELALRYFPKNGRVDLKFTYRGDAAFRRSDPDQAEFFMRTRKEGKLSGQYGSDYTFQGKTITQPDPNPKAPQYVVATLTPKDIEALRKYEKFEIIGVGYFTEKSGWRTYTLSSIDVWAAYQRVKKEASALRPGQRVATPKALAPKQSKLDAERDARFVSCSRRANERRDLTTRINDMARRGKFVMDDHRAAKNKVEEHRAEYKRLEQIANIMRSSAEVQQKYRSAVARYNESVREFNRLNDYVGDQKRAFDSLRARHSTLTKKLDADCYKSWPRATVRRHCKNGGGEHREFCASYSKR